MKYLIILGIVLFLFFICIPFRLFVLHPFATVYYLVTDVFYYFKHRDYNMYKAGMLNCYFAHFGGGKTLSLAHYICYLFKRYNNKKVWNRGKKKFVIQKMHIISNVHLNGVPYEELCSLSQIVCCAWKNKKIDDENNTRTCVIVLLDEASAQLNSREFKTNINADFLNTLITSRHFHMSIFYSSQKFKLVDALLRSVTQRCVSCNKIWRFLVQNYYDADDLELASSHTLIKPYRRTGFFVKNKDYNSYDTLATVEKLKKSVDKNDMMTDSEILAMRGQMNPDNEDILNPSGKLKRRLKKRK